MPKGQSTTEYIIITAIVLIIVFAAVQVLSSVPQSDQIIEQRTVIQYWSQASIGITQWVHNGTHLYMTIRNNMPQPINITQLVVAGAQIPTQMMLNPGATQGIIINHQFEGQQYAFDVKIHYIDIRSANTYTFYGQAPLSGMRGVLPEMSLGIDIFSLVNPSACISTQGATVIFEMLDGVEPFTFYEDSALLTPIVEIEFDDVCDSCYSWENAPVGTQTIYVTDQAAVSGSITFTLTHTPICVINTTINTVFDALSCPLGQGPNATTVYFGVDDATLPISFYEDIGFSVNITQDVTEDTGCGSDDCYFWSGVGSGIHPLFLLDADDEQGSVEFSIPYNDSHPLCDYTQMSPEGLGWEFFDGVSDYHDITAMIGDNLSDGNPTTISFWVDDLNYADSFNRAWIGMIEWDDMDCIMDINAFQINLEYFKGSDMLRLVMNDNSLWFDEQIDTQLPFHLAITYNESSISAYQNAVLIGSESFSGIDFTPDVVSLGGMLWNEKIPPYGPTNCGPYLSAPIEGNFSNTIYYKQKLTQQQVKHLYSLGAP